MDGLCLESIFSYCLPHHVYSVCSLVCREWSELVRSKDFFQRFSRNNTKNMFGPFQWIEMMSCVDYEFYELISSFLYSVKAENCKIIPNHIRITIPSSDPMRKYLIFYDCEMKLYKVLCDDSKEMIPFNGDETKIVDLVRNAKIVSAHVFTTTYYSVDLMHDETECNQTGLEWFLQQQLKYFDHIPSDYFFSILEFHTNPAEFRFGKFCLGGELLNALKYEKMIPQSNPRFKHFEISKIGQKASSLYSYPYDNALERLFSRKKLKKDLGIDLIRRGFSISVRTLLGRGNDSQLALDLLIEYCKVNEINILREIAMKDDIQITNAVQMIYYFVFQIPEWIYSPTHSMIDYFKTLDSNIHFPFASKCEIPLQKPRVCFIMKNSFQENSDGRIQLDRLSHITKNYVSSLDTHVIKENDPVDKLIEEMSNYDCIIYLGYNLEKTNITQEKKIDYDILKYLEQTGKRICFMFRERELRDFNKSSIPYLKHVHCGLFEYNERNIHTLITGKDSYIKDSNYKGVDPLQTPTNNEDEEEDDEFMGMFA